MSTNIIKKLTAIVCLTGTVAMVSARGSKDTAPASTQNRQVVAVSIVPEATFAKAVCGDQFDVITMIPPGYSPASYEPTPQELEKFSKAVIYFSVGVPTEKANIIPQLSKTTKLVPLAEKVAKIYPDRKMGDGRDPHIWMSPKRAIAMVNIIAEEFSEKDPANSSLYKKNAVAYAKKIEIAAEDIKNTLKKVQSRGFIVFHPAFGYFADDFNLKMYALEEEGKEATASRMIELVELAKKEHIKAVFYQAEIDSSQSKALAEELGGKTVQLAPLAPNYIENLKLMANTIAASME